MNEAPRQTKTGRPAFRVNPVQLKLTVNKKTKATLMRIAKDRKTSVSVLVDELAQTHN